jgi:hypothetical protein
MGQFPLASESVTGLFQEVPCVLSGHLPETEYKQRDATDVII